MSIGPFDMLPHELVLLIAGKLRVVNRHMLALTCKRLRTLVGGALTPIHVSCLNNYARLLPAIDMPYHAGGKTVSVRGNHDYNAMVARFAVSIAHAWATPGSRATAFKVSVEYHLLRDTVTYAITSFDVHILKVRDDGTFENVRAIDIDATTAREFARQFATRIREALT